MPFRRMHGCCNGVWDFFVMQWAIHVSGGRDFYYQNPSYFNLDYLIVLTSQDNQEEFQESSATKRPFKRGGDQEATQGVLWQTSFVSRILETHFAPRH